MNHGFGGAFTKGDVEGMIRKLNFTDLPISAPSRPSHHLEYLDLKNDLAWFEEITSEDDLKLGSVVNLDDDGKGFEKLFGSTTRLGLTLPSSFIRLLRSVKLLRGLPNMGVWYIDLEEPLHKIRKTLEKDITRSEEGYVFTWFWDDQSCYNTHMYLDTAGRHAILGSS